MSLVRALGAQTADRFGPILMLNSFDSADPADWKAGFPPHPHRSIETLRDAWSAPRRQDGESGDVRRGRSGGSSLRPRATP